MIQQSIRLKVLILPLSLIITVVLTIFFVKPSFTEMMIEKKTLNENKDRLEKIKSQIQKLQSVKSRWESLTDERILVDNALPESENVDSYISELTTKANRSGILLSDIKSGEENSGVLGSTYVCASNSANKASAASGLTESEDYSNCLMRVSVTLKAFGSWEQILDFLKYVEDMNRISNMEVVSLASNNQAQNKASDVLTVDIAMKAFFKRKSKGSNNIALAESLAREGGLNQKAINRLKEIVYSPYSAPVVSPGGERNIFK